MWRITALAALVALMGIAVLSMQTTSVHACTPPGPDFDAYGSSSLIIEGRILGWSVPPEAADQGVVPIVLDIDVARVWKGEGGRSVRIVAQDTLRLSQGELSWGPGGLCGVFHEDPTGSYRILGLGLSDDGSYRTLAFSMFFRGDGPEGEQYEAAVARLTALQAGIILPYTGTGPAPSTTTSHLVAGIAALGAALLAASFAIRFGTRSKI